MKISTAFQMYRNDFIVFRNQSRKTEENHFIAMKALVSYTGDIEIEHLSFEMIRDWKINMDKGRSSITVRGYIIKLRVVLRFLKDRGFDVVDPDAIPVPQRGDTIPEWVSPEDVKKLIDSTKVLRNKCIISLLYASGIRVSELCSLNRDSIREGSFTLLGKGKRARLCFVDERTQRLLDKYLATRKDNNPALFTGKYDSHRLTANNTQEIFRIARRAAGFTHTISPHTMRHSFATNLLRSNTNIRYVQTMLGHQSLETTQMYTHIVNEDLRKVYNEHHSI